MYTDSDESSYHSTDQQVDKMMAEQPSRIAPSSNEDDVNHLTNKIDQTEVSVHLFHS